MQYSQFVNGKRDNSSVRYSKCLPNCSDSCNIHPVQQGEVSSTEPPLAEPSVNGQSLETTGFLDSIEHYMSAAGIALLKISAADGIIESVTENIKNIINYSQSELLRQPIYSYLHPGDHAKLSPTLSNMSFQLGWDQQEDGQTNNRRPIKTRIRMLVKHPEGASNTAEQKQPHQDRYEEVILFAAPFNKGKQTTAFTVKRYYLVYYYIIVNCYL